MHIQLKEQSKTLNLRNLEKGETQQWTWTDRKGGFNGRKRGDLLMELTIKRRCFIGRL